MSADECGAEWKPLTNPPESLAQLSLSGRVHMANRNSRFETKTYAGFSGADVDKQPDLLTDGVSLYRRKTCIWFAQKECAADPVEKN